MQNRPYEGLFITIEGGEGAGKSTLARNLAHALTEKGHKTHLTREPGGTPLSEKIRSLLLEKNEHKMGARAELLLFLAARAEHVEEVILPKLYAGEAVICERFSDSTRAYQGSARHLGMEDVEALCRFAAHLIEPQVTLFLDVDPKEGLVRIKKGQRKEFDRMESERLQFHSEVRQGFLHLADRFPERITILDATQPKEEVLSQAIKVVEAHLKPKSHR